ncbi:phage regulatory CII family protein [Halopseudomonas salina]|uniref:Phage regulatory protein CII (CP76) n=1 Tax=Halopseudomonas salina TaxID=1323744 RepID=A0ABQ1NXQ5_9GAMM|nr:phage regulatory CII family protein [Halopseudomonas salina]GGC87284.1 hypothetical protein GCM10007418_03820 [Halopseudomonas salina]
MSREAKSCLERAKREILPLGLALYHACRDFRPGGAAGIAALYGRSASTLQHKVSPTQHSHTANPEDIEEIITATRDPRILDSIIESFGDAAWVDLRGVLPAVDTAAAMTSVIQAVGDVLKKKSALMQGVAEGLADDSHIDREELAACRKLIRQAQGALIALDRVLEHDAEGSGHD